MPNKPLIYRPTGPLVQQIKMASTKILGAKNIISKKFVVLTSGRNWIANILLDAILLHATRLYHPSEIIVVSSKTDDNLGPFLFFFKSAIRSILLKNNSIRPSLIFRTCYRTTACNLAKKHKIAFLEINEGELNKPRYLEMFKSLKADYCVSILWPKLISKEILDCFERTLNYHNSLLPSYRGSYSTQWSFYKKEKTTGYSFHLMTEKLDAGEVIFSNSVPISENSSVFQKEWEKTNLAAREMGEVLKFFICYKKSKKLQKCEYKASYFDCKDFLEIISIDYPNQLSGAEIMHRHRCFGNLNIRINDRMMSNIHKIRLYNYKQICIGSSEQIQTACGNYLVLNWSKIPDYWRTRVKQN